MGLVEQALGGEGDEGAGGSEMACPTLPATNVGAPVNAEGLTAGSAVVLPSNGSASGGTEGEAGVADERRPSGRRRRMTDPSGGGAIHDTPVVQC